jgi:hypothetical protein
VYNGGDNNIYLISILMDNVRALKNNYQNSVSDSSSASPSPSSSSSLVILNFTSQIKSL